MNKGTGWYKVKKVTDTVWYISDNDFALMYLVAGRDQALLIDTGFGVGNLSKLCSELSGLPVQVALTHAHPDHIMGAGQFDKVMIGEADIPILRYFFSQESRDETTFILKSPKFKNLPEELGDLWMKQTLKTVCSLKDGDTIDLGGRCIRVISTPGHTEGSVCLLDETDKLLFSGDTILKCNHLLNLEESASLEAFYESLARIKRLAGKFETILTGHEQSFLPQSQLDELIGGVIKILNGKLTGNYHKTVVGPGIKYRFGNRNSIVCKAEGPAPRSGIS